MKKLIIFFFIIISGPPVFSQETVLIRVVDFSVSNVSEVETDFLLKKLADSMTIPGLYYVLFPEVTGNILTELDSMENDEQYNQKLEELMELHSAYFAANGKLMACRYILAGNIGKLGKRFILTIKIIDSADGDDFKICCTAIGVYSSIEEMYEDIDNIALELLLQLCDSRK